MNYAIESIDMSDFCRLYSDRWEKEYKTENIPEQKTAVPGSQSC